MNMFIRKTSLILATLTLSLCSQISLSANEEAIKQLKQTSKGFSYVAKKVTPSVVSIEAHFNANQLAKEASPGSPRGRNQEDPFDFFTDEFFKHFFGPNGAMPGPRAMGKAPDQIGSGSGYIVSSDGYILTNSHVVKHAKKIIVTLDDGSEYEANLVGADAATDIAVIKIVAENLLAVSFGDSDKLEVGEWVIAIGTPLGLRASVTAGIISATGRSNLQITDFDDLLQTDAAINPGNSGGPLVNLDAEVIGMNTAIATKSGGYMGIGFAIPSNMVEHVKTQIIETGSVSRGFLGISPQNLNSELAASFSFEGRHGVLVAQIVPDSPAVEAGLMQGDIITEINGISMKDTASLRKTVALMEPGVSAEIKVFRNGETFETQVKLGTHPESPSQEVNDIFDQLGFNVSELSQEIAQEMGYQMGEGVLIKEVLPGSLADLAGIEAGNLILTVERKDVQSLADFTVAIKEAIEDGRVLFLVKQGDGRRFISLNLNP